MSAGEDGSGKTTLMSKLQGADHNKKGRGLEYLYLSVHDEDRDGMFTSCRFSGHRLITIQSHNNITLDICCCILLQSFSFLWCRPYPLQCVDPGWGPVSQRPFKVCCDSSVATWLPSRVRCGHVSTLDHYGVLTEVGQCAPWPCGQAKDSSRGHERNGAEEWVLHSTTFFCDGITTKCFGWHFILYINHRQLICCESTKNFCCPYSQNVNVQKLVFKYIYI